MDYEALKKFCIEQGADLFGVADISKDKEGFLISPKALEDLNFAVSLGIRLSGGILAEIENAPNRLYFHHYKTANAFLDQLAFKVGSYLEKQGACALPIPASQIVDWQKQSAHLSHKRIGYLAGLGWIGRNNLLVNELIGSQFRLTTILTDMPLKADSPTNKDCGDCQLCVRICPAQAIKKEPFDFDHQRCFEKLKEFQKARLVDQYICGVCVKVCKGKSQDKIGS